MKQIIIAVLFVLAPTFAFAGTLGCVGGGLTLGGIGSLIGGGKVPVVLAVIGGIMGCEAGSEIENDTYGRQAPTVTRTVTLASGGVASVPTDRPCPEHWDWAGSYHMREGYRRDPRSGGVTRDGCAPQRVQSVNPAVYRITETREQKKTPPPELPFGINVDNYRESGLIHKDCKSRVENPGRDGNCLQRKAKLLKLQQLACNNGGSLLVKNKGEKKKIDCPEWEVSPGQLAFIYTSLAELLITEQKKLQGGMEIVLEQ